jgi:putative endonuclease
VPEIIYYVYIIANKTGNVLYIGVTHDLPQRLAAHEQVYAAEFTSKYKVNHLVYYETAKSQADAIQRAERIKQYPREKKLYLINGLNPLNKDLTEMITK